MTSIEIVSTILALFGLLFAFETPRKHFVSIFASHPPLDLQKALDETAIDIHYAGNFVDQLSNLANRKEQMATLSIANRSSHVLRLSIDIYGTRINGELFGPYSSTYGNVVDGSIRNTKGSRVILLDPSETCTFDLLPFVKQVSEATISHSSNRSLIFDIPEQVISGLNNINQKLTLKPIEYFPRKPNHHEVDGIGWVANIHTQYRDGLSVNRVLFGGIAKCDTADVLQEVKAKQVGYFLFLDGFRPSGYSYVAKRGDVRAGMWVKDDFACICDNRGEFGAIINADTTRFDGFDEHNLCPLFFHALCVAKNGSYVADKPLQF